MTARTSAEMSLPSRYYIDPDYYREELEWFFGALWFQIGGASEIPARGDFVVRQIGDESLIVVRGERGQTSAFFNVCRHRGTRLCAEALGAVCGNDPVSLPRLDLRLEWQSDCGPAHGQ